MNDVRIPVLEVNEIVTPTLFRLSFPPRSRALNTKRNFGLVFLDFSPPWTPQESETEQMSESILSSLFNNEAHARSSRSESTRFVSK